MGWGGVPGRQGAAVDRCVRAKIARGMEEHKQPPPPQDLSGYLDALARVMFQTGISWRVVESKWPGTRDAFHGFDPDRVASLSAADIDRLMDDRRVIRNRKKLEAVVANARRMLELEGEHRGFDRYLDSLGDFETTRSELRKRFAFLGDAGAWYFLWTVGREVPEHERT
jgi:3-methyladenine DNA glycosylase Tag